MYEIYPWQEGEVTHLLDIQHDMFSDFTTRIVVPLVPAGTFKPLTTLNPTIDVLGIPHTLVPQNMTAVPVSALKNPIATAGPQRTEITAAIDRLFTGG